MINVLFIGDIVGYSSLEYFCDRFDDLLNRYDPDVIIVNGENICDGKGITKKEANTLLDLGVNVITTGNHIWDNFQSRPLLAENQLVLRPDNYPRGNVGKGVALLNVGVMNVKVAVMQLQGRTFMSPIECPFRAADRILNKLDPDTKVIIVDFHAEATSEKITLAHYLDGRVSAIVGTHTHVQTADAQILPKGSAYITDIGMTGPYNSAVGMDIEVSTKRFTSQTPHRYIVAEGNIRISGIQIMVDEITGLATSIDNFVFPSYNKVATNNINEQI